MKINGKEIKLYRPNGDTFTSVKAFLDFYNDQYYSTNNKDVEDKIEEILEDGIQSKEELFRVLAWVFMKIYMKKSTKDAFVYKGKSNEELMQLHVPHTEDFINKVEIEEIYKIIKAFSEKCSTDEDAQNFLNKIKTVTEEKSWGKQFHSVYMITLLYFVSKGKYPIVNSSSYVALEAIYNNAPFEKNIDDPKFVQPYDSGFDEIITKGAYKEYRDKLNKFVKLIKEPDLRKVDQALWEYGKLFKKN